MYPAIFSRTYPSQRISDVLQAIQADGFRGAQMNLLSFGMDSLPETLDRNALTTGCDEAASLGVKFAALSGTYNMAHPSAFFAGIGSGTAHGDIHCDALHGVTRCREYVGSPL